MHQIIKWGFYISTFFKNEHREYIAIIKLMMESVLFIFTNCTVTNF